jgi:hypothetical protein
MQLSKNFTLHELTRSQTASRLGINNDPPNELIPSLKRICDKLLEPPREFYNIPFSPTSGYRCLELNRAVGSKDTSQHVKGEAVDFDIPGIDNYELAMWLKNHIEEFDQLILEYYTIGEPNSGWIHMSVKEKENRRNTLTCTKGQYISGLIK